MEWTPEYIQAYIDGVPYYTFRNDGSGRAESWPFDKACYLKLNIAVGGDWGGYWSGKDTAFELLSTTMDNFTGMDYYIWITQGGGLKCYQDMYGKYNMTYFPIMINHAESGIRSTKPITSIKDMQSMKIRLGGVMAGRAAEKLGINITTVAASELYESLQRGVIDGGEFSGPKADDSLQLQAGFLVCAREARMPLFHSVKMLFDDLQSIQSGLSGFGSEIVQFQKALAEVLALGEPTTTALTEKPNLSPAVKPTTAVTKTPTKAVTKTRSRKK